MVEIRLSEKRDIPCLKEIWKVCFGDEDQYIDFFFENKYKEDETLVLIYKGEIAAMLTIIPTYLVAPNKEKHDAAMLYAIATDPKYRGKGFSTKLMDHAREYLKEHKIEILTLVPAEKSLIDFYSKRGYQLGFYIREALLTDKAIKNFPKGSYKDLIMEPATAGEYNRRRNLILQGKPYLAYHDDGIDYQKKLSQQSGADIYMMDTENVMGCAAIERINDKKVIIKELLIPQNLIQLGIRKIAETLPAKEYILRLPPYMEDIGYSSTIRPFGMLQLMGESNRHIDEDAFGYLGFAYD